MEPPGGHDAERMPLFQPDVTLWRLAQVEKLAEQNEKQIGRLHDDVTTLVASQAGASKAEDRIVRLFLAMIAFGQLATALAILLA